MSGAPEEVSARLVDRCAELVAGRMVIVVGGVAAAFTQLVRDVRGFGAREVLVVAQGTGTGDLPSTDEARLVVVEAARVTSATEDALASIAFADHPPAEAVAAVDAFDPDGGAICLLGPFATTRRYCGRESLGGRPEEIAALEDKTLADGIWDAAGVRRAPAVVVPLDAAMLAIAHTGLDQGAGTVWSGDASAGMNGGGDRVRVVRTEDEAAAAVELFTGSTRHVRVMPFLEGVPCSIHGFVLPDGVAAFRPVEQVILRGPGSARFIYAGLSTWWDPPPTDRDEMRSAAARVGRLLGEQFGLRGGFAVDGVLTADGFLPTELNPRFSGGLGMLARGLPGLPLFLAQMAAASGLDLGVSAAELEALIVAAADSSRYGVAQTVSETIESTATETVAVTGGSDRMTAAGDGEPVIGTVELGPANWGSLVRFQPAAMEPGERLADHRRRRPGLRRRAMGHRVRSAGGLPGRSRLTARDRPGRARPVPSGVAAVSRPGRSPARRGRRCPARRSRRPRRPGGRQSPSRSGRART